MSPANTPALWGNHNKKRLIEQLVQSGHADGAYIISGPAGVGKRRFAAYFAKLLTQPPTASGSQVSYAASCHTVSPLRSKNRKTKKTKEKEISVAQIRQALEFMGLKAPPNAYLVCLIQRAEKMSLAAQNALLKSLEEPGTSKVFILVVESQAKLLPTIQSRSTAIKLGLTSPALIMEKLTQRGVAAERARQAAYYSWGRPRTARRLSQHPDQLEDLAAAEKQLAEILAAPLWQRMLILEKESQDPSSLLEKVDHWLTYLTISLEKDLAPAIAKASNFQYNQKQIAALMQSLLVLRQKLKYSNASVQLALESAFLDV